MSSEKTNNSRRDFLVKSMALIPTVVIGSGSVGAVAAASTAQAAERATAGGSASATTGDWKPQFLTNVSGHLSTPR